MGGGGDLKYPIIYDKNTTDFFDLGLGPLTNTIEATVTEERNGAFYFEAEVLIDDKYELIKENSIIKVDAGHTLKDQRFRIKRITPTDEGTAKIYAEHISYLAQELSLQPDIHLSGSAQVVLGIWKDSIIDSNPFVVDSDVSTVSSTHFDISEVSNAREALGGVKGSILDRWGGEYRFDNYHISLLKKRGKPANTLLAYGRNITDFEQDRNITNTYTSVYPFAKYTDDNQKEHLVTIPGYLVDSEHVDKYPNRKALPVDFSNEFKDKAIPTADKLKKLAEAYIKDNEVGIPKVSIKLSFLDLSKTLDYEELAPLEELSLCDEVRVSYEKLDVNTTAKVIRTVWNVLTESYDEIEIGEKRMTLSSTLNDQSQAIKEIKDQSNYSLIAANGKNTIFYGLYGADGTGQPVATMIGDMWYKPVGEDTEFYIWDGTVWKFIMSTVDNKIIQETIDQLEAESEQIKQDVDQALADAEQARDDAFNSDKLAKEAKELAELANQGVISVDEKSNQALADAERAREEAFDSKAIADEAKLESSKALQKGNHNEVEISRLEGQLQVTNSKVEGNTTNLLNLKLESDKLSSSVSKTQYDLENFDNSNLLINSKGDNIDGYGRWGGSSLSINDNAIYVKNNNSLTNFGVHTPKFLVERGKTYTIQADVSSYYNTRSLNYFYLLYSDGGAQQLDTFPVNASTADFNTFNVKMIPHKTDNVQLLFGVDVRLDPNKESTGFRIKKIKISSGRHDNKNWTPSNLDLVSQHEFSTFEQTYQGFQTNVQSDILNVKSQQTQMANQISSTVEEVANIKVGVMNRLKYSNQPHKMDFVATAGESGLLKMSDNLVDGIQTKKITKTSDNYTVWQYFGIRPSGIYKPLNFNLYKNWTITFRCYSNQDDVLTLVRVVDGDGKNLNVHFPTVTFKKGWNTITLQSAVVNENPEDKNMIYLMTTNWKKDTEVDIAWVVLSNGSLKLDNWSPAPEDLANKSEVTQLSDQITQTITKTNVIEGQLSQQQSQVNQLSDKLTVNISDTSANATKISQLELTSDSMSLTLASVERENDRLNTKVVSLEANLNGFQATVSDELNGVKAQQTLMSTQMNTTISKVDTIDGKVSKQQTEITQLSNSISSIVEEVETGSSENLFQDFDFKKQYPEISPVDQYGEATYVYNGLELVSIVYLNAVFKIPFKHTNNTSLVIRAVVTAKTDTRFTFGNIEANTSEQVTLKAGESITVENSIKYLDSDGNTAVSVRSGTIVVHELYIEEPSGILKRSEFHQFSDKFLFQVGTNKLMITEETTYIANATIDNAMIKDAAISNAKIQDATISNAKIINVDAAKITTGYLNANRIQARSITANHLAVDAITVGFNNSSTNINLYGDRIEMSQNGRKTAQLVGKGLSFHDGASEVGSFRFTKGLLNSTQRGITMDITSAGDFLSMGTGNSDLDTYPYFMIDKTGKNNIEGHKGIWFGENMFFKGDIKMNGANHALRFNSIRFNNYDYPALLHQDYKTGIAFGANVLYLINNGNVYSVGDIVRGAGFN